MKKLITLLLALLFILTACAPAAVEQAPAPVETPEPAGEATPEPTPPLPPALAICTPNNDVPLYRQAQLGFIDTLKDLGYADISIIGSSDGSTSKQYDALIGWAESLNGRPGGVLLFDESDSVGLICSELQKLGVKTGLAGKYHKEFIFPVDADFICAYSHEATGIQMAETLFNDDDTVTGIVSADTDTTLLDLEAQAFMKYIDDYYESRDIYWAFDGYINYQHYVCDYDDYYKSATDGDALKRVLSGLYDYLNIREWYVTAGCRLEGFLDIYYSLGRRRYEPVHEKSSLYGYFIEEFQNGRIATANIINYYEIGKTGAQKLHSLFDGEATGYNNTISAQKLTEDTRENLIPYLNSILDRAEDENSFKSYEKSFSQTELSSSPADTSIPLAIYVDMPTNRGMRQAQLGFLDSCRAMGYDDLTVIGSGRRREKYKYILEWAESLQGKKAAILLFSNDNSIKSICPTLKNYGITVGLAGEVFDALPEGVDILCRYSYDDLGSINAELFMNSHDLGDKQPMVISGDVLQSQYDEESEAFYNAIDTYYSHAHSSSIKPYIRTDNYEGDIWYVRESKTSVPYFKDVYRDMDKFTNPSALYITSSVNPGNFISVAQEMELPQKGILLQGSATVTEKNLAGFEEGVLSSLTVIPHYDKGRIGAIMLSNALNKEGEVAFKLLSPYVLTHENSDNLIPRFKELIRICDDDSSFSRYKYIGEVR